MNWNHLWYIVSKYHIPYIVLYSPTLQARSHVKRIDRTIKLESTYIDQFKRREQSERSV